MHAYIHTYIRTYIDIYIYIWREKDREICRQTGNEIVFPLSASACLQMVGLTICVGG